MGVPQVGEEVFEAEAAAVERAGHWGGQVSGIFFIYVMMGYSIDYICLDYYGIVIIGLPSANEYNV